MTRRGFVQSLVACAAVFGLKPSGYGRVDVHRWNQMGLRALGASVLVDGQDVTNDCYLFDDREGWAEVFLRDSAGRLRADRSAAATRRIVGRITVEIPR